MSYTLLTVKKPGVQGVFYNLAPGASDASEGVIAKYYPISVGEQGVFRQAINVPTGQFGYGADFYIVTRVYDNGFLQVDSWKVPGMTSSNVEQKMNEYFYISTIEYNEDGTWSTNDTTIQLPMWLYTDGIIDKFGAGLIPKEWWNKYKWWLYLIGGLLVYNAFSKKK